MTSEVKDSNFLTGPLKHKTLILKCVFVYCELNLLLYRLFSIQCLNNEQDSRTLLYKIPNQCRNNMGDAQNCEARAPLPPFNECLEMAYGYRIS